MLHAELHHKFALETLGFERSEDILTSTVFGTLLIAEGGQSILRAWLRKSRFGRDHVPLELPSISTEYHFWPRLEGCIPDLALRFGDLACVLEAKYLSGASDIEVEGILERKQQLQTQWKACASGVKLLSKFGASERFKNVALLYVVDGVRGVRASKEAVEQARASDSNAQIGLLFWQDLHITLRELLDQKPGAPSWPADMASLLENRQLGAFTGFPKKFDPDTVRDARMIYSWRHTACRFRAALATVDGIRLSKFQKALSDWRLAP